MNGGVGVMNALFFWMNDFLLVYEFGSSVKYIIEDCKIIEN